MDNPQDENYDQPTPEEDHQWCEQTAHAFQSNLEPIHGDYFMDDDYGQEPPG